MNPELEKTINDKKSTVEPEIAQKLKYSMLYYFKFRQSHENLLMFVMDV